MRRNKRDLTPTPESPGLRIYAPSADERDPRYPQSPSHLEVSNDVPRTLGDTPHAEYACRCGKTAKASGVAGVRAVVASWEEHGQVHPRKGLLG
jgi:hypothetical protein